jgi:hypothetical protein
MFHLYVYALVVVASHASVHAFYTSNQSHLYQVDSLATMDEG